MTSRKEPEMPPEVAEIRDCGFAIWASDRVAESLRDNFDGQRIPVRGIRHVRVWGLQVDDERELPGHERTMIPDEDLETSGSAGASSSRLAMLTGAVQAMMARLENIEKRELQGESGNKKEQRGKSKESISSGESFEVIPEPKTKA